MNLFSAFAVGLKEIWANKFRAVLTMLGIILGVASLVAMTALIKGMENGMKEAMVAMGGADKVRTQQQAVPPWQDHLADQAPGRTMADVHALRQSAPLIRLVSPELEIEDMSAHSGRTSLQAYVPTRGLIGFEFDLMNQTSGHGIHSHLFKEYAPHAGPMQTRGS